MFPDYLLYGMTYEQFWKGNPYLAKDYREAFRRRRELENENMWLQGLYIYDAVTVAVHNNLAKKPLKYMEEPIRFTPMTKKEKEEQAQREKEKAKEELKKFANFFDAKFGAKNG